MPRYEFLCEKRKKLFELIMTISERREGQGQVPDVQKHEGSVAARVFHDADVEEELRARGGT